VRPLSCSLVHLTNSIEGLTSFKVWDLGLMTLGLFETAPVTMLAATTGLGLATAGFKAGVVAGATAFPPAPTVAQPPAAYSDPTELAPLRGTAIRSHSLQAKDW
jgi:hypothetical protein